MANKYSLNELEVRCDSDRIKSRILALKEKFVEEEYSEIGVLPDDKNFRYFTKEEYDRNIDNFLTSFIGCDPEKIKADFEKKKNGSFHKKRVVYVATCENGVFFSDYYPAWDFHAVKAIPISDTILEIQFDGITKTSDEL